MVFNIDLMPQLALAILVYAIFLAPYLMVLRELLSREHTNADILIWTCIFAVLATIVVLIGWHSMPSWGIVIPAPERHPALLV